MLYIHLVLYLKIFIHKHIFQTHHDILNFIPITYHMLSAHHYLHNILIVCYKKKSSSLLQWTNFSFLCYLVFAITFHSLFIYIFVIHFNVPLYSSNVIYYRETFWIICLVSCTMWLTCFSFYIICFHILKQKIFFIFWPNFVFYSIWWCNTYMP